MEISLFDEVPLKEIINDKKALQYDIKYNWKHKEEFPVYKQLDMMKNENEDNVIVSTCKFQSIF